MTHYYNKIKVKSWYAYLMIAFSALLFTVAIQAFVQTAHTLTSGVSALSVAATLLVKELKPYVGLLYFGLNVPLILFYWKKINKRFLYKTILFLILQSAFGLVFTNQSIRSVFENSIINKDKVLETIWPIFLLASIGGILSGSSIAIAWKYGSSSGGGDIISYYYSMKHKKPVGTISFFVSMTFVVISFSITVIIDESIRKYALTVLIATILYVAITSLMINILYPRYSIVLIEIHSSHIQKISDFLRKTNYAHSWQVRTITSGYTSSNKKIITTALLLLEVRNLREKIRAIDKDVWIIVTKAAKVYGNFNTEINE